MANPYCTIDQFFWLHDRKTMGQLSNDEGMRQADNTRVQFLLDTAASYIESFLGAWSPPIVNPPLVLTMAVADNAAGRLYQRRSAMPKELASRLDNLDKWLADLASGSVTLPGISRAIGPSLSHAHDEFDSSCGRRIVGSVSDIL